MHFGTRIECTAKTGTEEKKLLNKDINFIFFPHKNYSQNFRELRLNLCHMDCFNDVLTTFLDLECGSSLAAGSESSQILSKIS